MTRLALAHYALCATLAFAAGWASRDASVIWASGPEPYLGDPLVVPPGDPRLLFQGTGIGGGILTPTPDVPEGCTWGGWCDEPTVEVTPPPVAPIPVPPALVLLTGGIGLLVMMRRRRR